VSAIFPFKACSCKGFCTCIRPCAAEIVLERSNIVGDHGQGAGVYTTQVWKKSGRSNPSGNCVELSELPSGEIAMRNSRFPDGPMLIYTRAEIEAFIGGAKDGDFDHLVP
jgi:uncharacterized protein DUF397